MMLVEGERKYKMKLKGSGCGSKVVLPRCNKRKLNLDTGVDDQPNLKKLKIDLSVEKQKRKMDPNLKQQCGGVLDALLAHNYGFVFKCPVDPIALNIPDYMTVISHPMDLGTVKSKLTANAYCTAQEFAADVKLTFSNAMLYTPPDNQVHSMAKELDCLFIKRWNLLEAKWNHGIASATCSVNSVPSKAPVMSVDEKRKLKKELIEILVGRMPEKLKSEIRKLGLEIPSKQVIDLEFDRFDEHVLWQLQRVVKDSKPSALNSTGIAKSGSALNGETDLKKALIAARAAKMKKQQSAESRKVQQEAKANCDAKACIDARRTEERKARADLEKNRNFEEDKVLAYDQLLQLCGCSLSYDSHIGVVLRMREFKTGKLVDPLASIGLHLKKEFIANATDYDEYVDMDIEEGEIVDSDCVFVGCDMDLEEGEILE